MPDIPTMFSNFNGLNMTAIRFRFLCDTISHRQGFIEVMPGVHPGCINIETWEVSGEIAGTDIGDYDAMPERVGHNTELEMSIVVAERLVEALVEAIAMARVGYLANGRAGSSI